MNGRHALLIILQFFCYKIQIWYIHWISSEYIHATFFYYFFGEGWNFEGLHCIKCIEGFFECLKCILGISFIYKEKSHDSIYIYLHILNRKFFVEESQLALIFLVKFVFIDKRIYDRLIYCEISLKNI